MPDESFGDALRQAGLRPTRQRLAVLDALQGRSEAVTAQELHHHLRRSGAAPGLTTVYRTLAALAEAGLLDVFPQEGEQAFRLCGARHHHHLLCTSCGTVKEVEATEVEAWVARIARRSGFQVTGHRADVYGICGTCR